MIRRALESVHSQGYESVDHIVVDGGSTDGTLDVVREFRNVRLIVERDRGLYDAINKGLQNARGGVIGLLNTDDYFEPGALEAVVAEFRKDESLDCVAGAFAVVEESSAGSAEKRTEQMAPSYLGTDLPAVLGLNPAVNAKFFRRGVFDACGPFDLKYAISADRKFLIEAALKGLRSVVLPKILYNYFWHSKSLTFNVASLSNRQAASENLAIAEEFLRTGNCSVGQERLLRNFHRRISIQEAVAAVYLLRPGEFLGFASRGIAVNGTWPTGFVAELWKAAKNRLQRSRPSL
jgi:glycosyltransferase involved in cell wall biosynthesis